MRKVIVIVVSALLSLGLIGCNSSSKNNETSTSKGKNETVTVPKRETKVFHEDEGNSTYEDFLNVKVGKDYEEVVNELGEPNQLVTEGEKNTYFWTLKNGGSISVIVEDNKVINISQGLLKDSNSKITIEQYEKLEDGMTIEEVEAIAGQGSLSTEEQMDGYVRSFYAYRNENDSSAIITYHDGKLYSKSQNNLE